MKEQRTVIRGELGHDAKVTSLDAVAKLPTATIEDCVDLLKWQTIDTRTNTSTGPWGTQLPRMSLPRPGVGEGNGKQLRSPCPFGSWCRTLRCNTASARTTGFGRFPCYIRPPCSARN